MRVCTSSTLLPTLVVICLIGTVPLSESHAQELSVARSVPEYGAREVPLEATIIFEYNRAPGYSTSDWNTAVVEPRDKVRIRSVELCLGEDPCSDGEVPRFVRYHVEHAPGTDVTWMLYSTRAIDSSTGDTLGMTEPYVLRYSTASDLGEATVAGRIETAPYEVPTAKTRELLATLARRVMNQKLAAAPRQQALPEASSTTAETLSIKSPATAPTAQPPDDHTLVLLLETLSLNEDDWTVRAGMVIPGDEGTFEIDYVRSGTYWPLAVRFTSRERTAIEAIGFYDEHHDRIPDPITIDSTSPPEISLTLFDYPLVTARSGLGLAFTEAHSLADDQRLLEVRSSYGARPAGTAYDWHYRFYSATQDRVTAVTVSPFGTRLQTTPADDEEAAHPPLPAAFIDSDEALALVLEDGGQAFIDENAYRPANLNTDIRGTFFEGSDGVSYWHVRLSGRTAQGTKTFERYVAMSGEEVHAEAPTLATSPGEASPAFSTGPNYPNPFSGETRIPLSLDTQSVVTLEIYDVLGRRVDTLLKAEVLPAGRHTVRWEAGALPSGTYFYRVLAGPKVYTHGMTLQR